MKTPLLRFRRVVHKPREMAKAESEVVRPSRIAHRSGPHRNVSYSREPNVQMHNETPLKCGDALGEVTPDALDKRETGKAIKKATLGVLDTMKI
ncbi:hypothetical protein MRX96_026519 [Rhipicephalus microplus]